MCSTCEIASMEGRVCPCQSVLNGSVQEFDETCLQPCTVATALQTCGASISSNSALRVTNGAVASEDAKDDRITRGSADHPANQDFPLDRAQVCTLLQHTQPEEGLAAFRFRAER